jgi:hypothetical protein
MSSSKLWAVFVVLWGMVKEMDREDIEKFVDSIIDYFEDNFPDNAFVQGSCEVIRNIFKIPDNDEPGPGLLTKCPDKDCNCDE